MTLLVETLISAAAILLLVGMAGFCSGVLGALVAAHRFRLRPGAPHSNTAATRRVEWLAENAQRIQFAVLIVSTVAASGAAAAAILASDAFVRLLDFPPDWRTRGLALALVFLLLLVAGETVPQRLFRRSGQRTIARLAGPIRGVMAGVGFLADALMELARLLFWLLAGRKAVPSDVLIPAEPWSALLAEATEPAPTPGSDDALERRMIQAVFALERIRVREAMRPIADLVAVRLPESVEAVRRLARETGYSRFPVYRDRIINLCGYVDIYDILGAGGMENKSVEDFVREPLYVPETLRLDVLLRELLQGRHKVAFAVDEYGACSGWVTREDLLEEIVGEIEDEFDRGREPFRRESDHSWLAQASLRIEQIRQITGLQLPSDGFDTLGGYLYDRLGRIPRVGDVVVDAGARFEVTEMDQRRIVAVRIVLPPAGPNSESKT
ncbi:MAG: hemolysin family protein [Candidatus Sumerlaeia bacterium]|nr:hemolysin family protein [Candidatus Sumerlaeia bacterium]